MIRKESEVIDSIQIAHIELTHLIYPHVAHIADNDGYLEKMIKHAQRDYKLPLQSSWIPTC